MHVVTALESRGFRVARLARTGESDAARGSFAFDIANPPKDLFSLLGRPEIVVHLAWGQLQNYSSRNHYDVELPMHYRFLELLVRSGARKVVVAGTCFEYGRRNGCLYEELAPNPENPYGYAKDALRRQLDFLRKELGFELIWIRLFYLYGEGQGGHTLFGQLAAAIERGDEFFPMTGGEQLRDYLPVEKAATAIATIATIEVQSQSINVSSGNPRSIRSLVEAKIQEAGSQITPLLGFLPYSEHEAMAFWGCRRKLDDILKLASV